MRYAALILGLMFAVGGALYLGVYSPPKDSGEVIAGAVLLLAAAVLLAACVLGFEVAAAARRWEESQARRRVRDAGASGAAAHLESLGEARREEH